MNTAITFALWFVVAAVGIWIVFVAVWLGWIITLARSLGQSLSKPGLFDGPVAARKPRVEYRRATA